MVYLARRDVESTGAQVYSLPLVNEGQHKDNPRALWRTNSPQTKHDYPLVVRHRLQKHQEQTVGYFYSERDSGRAVGVTGEEIVSAYFQYKPSCYRECYKGADGDQEDHNQVANPGHPSLGGILKKTNKQTN